VTSRTRNRAEICEYPVGRAVDVHSAPRDSDYVVFRFAKLEDADTFFERFGGERLSGRRQQ
jgi:hypothetical protein